MEIMRSEGADTHPAVRLYTADQAQTVHTLTYSVGIEYTLAYYSQQSTAEHDSAALPDPRQVVRRSVFR
jgi:hypothetical protein